MLCVHRATDSGGPVTKLKLKPQLFGENRQNCPKTSTVLFWPFTFVYRLPKSTMAWFNSEVCGRQRKYMKGSCLMGESFGWHVPNDSIRHDTLIHHQYRYKTTRQHYDCVIY